MTRDREFKRKVRHRMALTGERYTAARQALIGPPPPPPTGRNSGGATPAMTTHTHVTVQFMTDALQERAAESRLRDVLGRWNLDRYIYFEQIRIDATAKRPTSFPVPTFPPAVLSEDDDVTVLRSFVHAQMHWALDELDGAEAAVEEIAIAHPEYEIAKRELPCGTGDAAAHAVVHLLEIASLIDICRGGQDEANAQASPHSPGALLPSGDALHEFVARHGLTLPAAPPNARRRAAPIDLRPSGPLLTLTMGQQQELALAGRLRDAHARNDLTPWQFSPQVRIESAGLPPLNNAVPAISTQYLFRPPAALVLAYVHSQATWWARQHDTANLEDVVGDALDTAVSTEVTHPRREMLLVAFACVVAIDATRRYFPEDVMLEAVRREPSKAAIYEAVSSDVDARLARIAEVGIPTTAPRHDG